MAQHGSPPAAVAGWISRRSAATLRTMFADIFEPMTGEVKGRVALASTEEVRAVVLDARAAQPAWAAVNPQRRARVFMNFLEPIHTNMDELAELRSAFGDLNQHGPDAIRFYTMTKNVTARWPSGAKEGAEFSMPTM